MWTLVCGRFCQALTSRIARTECIVVDQPYEGLQEGDIVTAFEQCMAWKNLRDTCVRATALRFYRGNPRAEYFWTVNV